MSKVEQGLPLPPVNYNGGRHAKYPMDALKPGESFFTERKPGMAHWKKRTGKQFSCRSVIENGKKGFRIWRCEDKQTL